MLNIRKGVEVPKSVRTAPPARRKYPFEEMEVGDMFFVPNKDKNTLATHASTVGKRMGRKFITRMIVEDGVTGIGCWRTE